MAGKLSTEKGGEVLWGETLVLGAKLMLKVKASSGGAGLFRWAWLFQVKLGT